MLQADIQKIPRTFFPANFEIQSWQDIQPYIDQLLSMEMQTTAELEQWLSKVSEVEAVISEDACWRQIKMTCDTQDKALEESFNFWCTDIQPQITIAFDALNRKLVAHPLTATLDSNKYGIYLRNIKTAIELFNDANVALQSQESLLAQQFGVINAKMSIEVNGQTYTLQQAATFLQQSDRNLRKEVYEKVAARRAEDREALNKLFDELLVLRQQIATNAGFDNYRDYKFKALGRFDYTVADCENFHNAIKQYILPICDEVFQAKKKQLGLDELRPYDLDAEPEGQLPLRPFTDGADLTEKSIAVFDQLGPFFGDCLRKMKSMQHLNLDSKIGKAPGGYNCPLAETGVPFIFMNAASTADDVVTMMHEGGHAIHSFVCHAQPLTAFKEYPMEIAELASMSMELFTMEHWPIFYPTKDELKRAQLEVLERALTILPWIAIIDKFQHWLYTHPGHSVAERTTAWTTIQNEFSTQSVNYSGYETYRANFWQKQLHLFEVPFYYIEYGIAQLGALGMWQQYKSNPQQALDNYLEALSLGNTKGLKELYATAGIAFDFSEANVAKLSRFVQEEMRKME